MRYVIAIKGSVYGSQGAFLAYQLAEALLEKGHEISQIFFFQNGVHNGNNFISPSSDEINLVEKWQKLAETHRLSLHLCISAAQRRGITEQTLANGFILTGLGEFTKATLMADRLLTL